MKKILALLLFIFSGLVIPAGAAVFTETFNSTFFMDAPGSTADWDTAAGRASLARVSRFAQTVDVTGWGGCVMAIECDPAGGKWLMGGLDGKINEYDGTRFINRIGSLSGSWTTGTIYAIEANGFRWLIGGSGHRLNKWDGVSDYFTDLTSRMPDNWTIMAIGAATAGPQYWLAGGTLCNLYRFEGADPDTAVSLKAELLSAGFNNENVYCMAYSKTGGYWLIGGGNGRLVKYDGLAFYDLSAQLNFGSNFVNAIDWCDAGAADGTFLIGGTSKMLATYSGSFFTSHSGDAGLHFSNIGSIKWNGSCWLIGGIDGPNTRITAYDGGSSYSDFPALPYFDNDMVYAIGSDGKGDAGVNFEGGRNSKLNRSTGAMYSPLNADFTGLMSDSGEFNIKCAEYNGLYWLLGGSAGSLNRCDGSICADLRAQLGWASQDVLCAGWNAGGGYWLIGGTGGRLAKYDGTVMSDRTPNLGFGGNDVRAVKWNGTRWLIGGNNRSLSASIDADFYAAADLSPYFGPADSVNTVEWSAVDSLWYIAGSSGCMASYDGLAAFIPLRNGLESCLGGYYGINSLKSGAGSVMIGCDGARLAEYSAGSFTDRSGSLINFGGEKILAIGYAPGLQEWAVAGGAGKINFADGAMDFYDQSGNLVNFRGVAVNCANFGNSEWFIGGDYSKLNTYGMSFADYGWAVSSPLDSWFSGYESVTLTDTCVLNGQQVDYWLSANNGATWVPAEPGMGLTFSGADNGISLRWKARLLTYNKDYSPYIDTVMIDYRHKAAPTYTATPSSTASRTRTFTPSFTRTITGTRTATPTGTSTMTPTPTVTRTVTLTSTPTRTGTPTFSGTVTRTFTATATVTRTMTVTVTVTVTRTITLTQSDSPTATETPTITETHTITETGTITETHTVSPTFTWTPTITWTATVTLTHTETPDFTQTCTITPFYSATPTPTRGPVTAGVNESILYPNPARDRINLSYYMKEAGRVKIRIYNEAGGLAALQEENRPAGNGISFIETEKMAVGVYFCFISLNYSSGMSDKFGVKKFLLIR